MFSVFAVDGNDLSQEGHWVHNDGSHVTVQEWAVGQPGGGISENCLSVINEKLQDVACSGYMYSYVCERQLFI